MIKLSDNTIFDTKTGIYYSIEKRWNPGMTYDEAISAGKDKIWDVVTINSIHNSNESNQLVISQNAIRFWGWLTENCVNF